MSDGEQLCDIPKKLVFHGSFDLKNDRPNVLLLLPKTKGPIGIKNFKKLIKDNFNLLEYDDVATEKLGIFSTSNITSLKNKALAVNIALEKWKGIKFHIICHSTGCGLGTFIAKNDWAANRNAVEGMTFAIDNDFVGLDLGITQRDNGDGSEKLDAMWINAAKSSGDWSVNLLYSDYVAESASQGVSLDAQAMGLDFAYSAMGGALNLDVSYNTLTMGDMEMDMMDISGTYTVNDDMSITAGRASYGENGFNDLLGLGNRGWYGTNSWMSHGNLGHLGANEENMYIGGSYNMGAFTLGATVHNVTNTEDDSYERAATEVTVGYTLGDNASLSYKMASDNNGGEEDTNYNWLTLTVTP